MPLDGNVFAFGLREIKIKRGATVVSLPAAQTLRFTERVVSVELKGNDRVVVAGSHVEAIEFEFSNGGIPLDAYALMTGRTMTDAGTAPNQTTTMTIRAGDTFPYFTLYGKSMGDVGDDVHVKLYKCKLTGGIEGTFQNDQFYISTMRGIAVQDDTEGKIADIVRNETATALPS
jgi:hypothetical protein